MEGQQSPMDIDPPKVVAQDNALVPENLNRMSTSTIHGNVTIIKVYTNIFLKFAYYIVYKI